MTLNATILSVEQLKRAGFVEREFYRVRPGRERKRIVMLPAEIDQMLDSRGSEFPSIWASDSLDTFRAGSLVTVSRQPSAKPDLKLLRDVDEVWAFAIRKPRDFQARLLGRFIHQDIFVGLEFALRTELGSPDQYHAHAERVAAAWDERTGGIRPIRSASNSDYLSHVFRDLDNE